MWASNIRVFTVFAVIMLHSSARFLGQPNLSQADYGNPSWWTGNIFDSITRWCVPVFIMISGYFLLNKQEDTKVFIKKRVSRILVPLIFWSIFFSLVTAFKLYMKGDISSAPMKIAHSYFIGAPYYHLWFLFMIPFLYAITPILRVAMKQLSKQKMLFFILFCFSIEILNALFNYVMIPVDMESKYSFFANGFLSFLGYFILGGYINKYDIKVKLSTCLPLLVIALATTMLGTYFFTYEYFYSSLSINVVILSICTFFLIKQYANIDMKMEQLSVLSFGIYLVHPVFLDILLVYRDKMLSVLNASTYILLLSTTVFLLSYCVAFLINKTPYLKKVI